MKKLICAILCMFAGQALAQSVGEATDTVEGLKATADFKEGGGRHGNGTVILNGQTFNADDLVPAGDNQAYLDRLKRIDGRKSLDGLRDAYDELKPQIDKDPSSWAEATRTATVTPKEMTRIEDETKNDGAFWQSQLDAIRSSQGAAGELLQECTTNTVVTPGSKELTYTEEKYCDLVNIPEDKQSAGVCQRQANYTETPTSDRKEKTAQLFVTEEGNGTVCKRETKAENYRDTLAGTITSTIDITEETGGLSCRREIVPEATFQDVTGSKEATLPIDHQVPGAVCNVELWPTVVDRPNNGSRFATLNVNNEVGGLVCTRTRVAIAGSSNSRKTLSWGGGNTAEMAMQAYWRIPEPPTAIISNMVMTMRGGSCNGATFDGFTSVSWDGVGGRWNTNIAGLPQCFDDIFNPNPGQWELSYTVGSPTLNFSLSETGNCNDNGTGNCPAVWQCTAYAPTWLNGVLVNPSDVASLGSLYPGASQECVSSQKVRSCGGTANTSNEISFAADVSAAAINFSSFLWDVRNPQAGVTVTLTQMPTKANGWVAKFNVARTNFGSVPANPEIFVMWQTDTPNSNLGATQVGDCSGAAASPNCPTKWTCSARAPITINGIVVSAADAATKAPLFPGAPADCAKAQLDKVCSGTASLSSVISIADKIPEGVTAIRDFKVTVKNPQNGVTVTLISAPTFENAWNASFRVDRTDFSTNPAEPQIIMTWGATITVITSKVVDTGNCKDPGSEACPTRWTCDKNAPATVNGILVTAEMAKQYAPLFPGASNICAAGNLSRVCDGASAVVSSIYIGHLLSKDSTAITNFVWKVNNPQAGVVVELVDAPSLTNGWIARFKATRDYKVAKNPQKPSLTLNWSYLSELKVRTSIITTGDCEDIYGGLASAPGGSPAARSGALYASAESAQQLKSKADSGGREVGLFETAAQAVLDGLVPTAAANPLLLTMSALAPSTCPVAWVCTKAAPGTANGIDVSVEDLKQRGELYPGENYTCLDAEYRRTCSGAGANTTVVSIADQVPADAVKITNFGWHVVDPGKGVSISLIQTPTKENGWKAIFQTTRTDWNVKAEQPTVRLAWDQLGIPKWDVNTADQGDCSKEGDEFCQAEWFCVEKYPDDPPVPDVVTSRSQTYKGADDIGVALNYNFSVASQMPSGTNAIYDFRIGSLSGTADVSIIVEPSKANNWVGTVKVTTKGYEYEYVAGKPLSRYSQATLAFTWKLGERPPYVAPPYRSQSPGPLFPGDDGSCKRAEKRYTCEKIWEGKICFTDVDGQETCLDQPKTDGPPNDCGRLEDDETCTEVREQCTEDGMSSDGHCYVSTKVFECKVKVVVDDATIDEETTCKGGGVTPCMDGSCVQQEKNTTSASTAAAHVATMQTMLIDHDAAPSATGGKVSMRVVPSKDESRTQGMLLAALQKVIDGVIPSASAQDDPFGVPLPYPVPKEDPPGNPADAMGPGVAEDMLSKMKFFVGTRESCKKMLGGLLDCCTKEPPDQQKEWWTRYGTFTRENGMAELLSMPDEQNGDGTGVWDNYDATSNSMTLNSTFTSIAENVKAGGTASGGSVDATLNDLSKQFQGYSDKEVKPKLGWYCKDDEKDLAIKKNLGQCTYIGSYCQTKGLLGECIVKQHVSCCFNSTITKMIRDKFAKEGRFGFGTAKRPTCDGIPLTALMQENMTDFNTDEVEARMAAGGFSPDVASLSSLSGEEFDVAMFGSGNSLNDPERKGLTERTEDRLDGMSDNMSAGFDAIGNSLGTRSNTTNTDVVDPESPGAITFNPGLYIVENGKVASITVNRNGGKGEVSVTLRSIGGTAAAGTDYPSVNTTLTWKSGEIGEKIVTVPITERVRSTVTTVELRINNPTNGAIINPLTNATIEIQPTRKED